MSVTKYRRGYDIVRTNMVAGLPFTCHDISKEVGYGTAVRVISELVQKNVLVVGAKAPTGGRMAHIYMTKTLRRNLGL